MNVMSSELESLQLSVTLETRVNAPIETTFQAVLDQLSAFFETPEGVSLSMKLEPWPGGRWYRDLGDNNGHFWGNVQAIKRPTLLEISGPLFASSPLFSNLQYRLSEIPEGTLITLRHTALGFVMEGEEIVAAGPAHKDKITLGWKHTLERVRQQAESGSPAGQPAGARSGTNGG